MWLPIWRISPVAPLDDPRWLDHQPIPEILVRAPTAAAARVLASETPLSNSAGGVGNESANNHSRLLDEKLYRVDRTGEYGPPDGAGDQPGVVSPARRTPEA